MKRLCLAFLGLAALTGSAAAADLSRPAPAPYYKGPAFVPPSYNWSGFYVGVNGGGGFGSSAWNSTGSFDISGGQVGGTVGYNYQWGQAVVGVEGDIDWTNLKGSTSTFCAPGCTTSNTWLSTARARLGYAADRFMPYVTGGAAFGNIRATVPGLAGASNTETGWTIGAGLEGAIAGGWTAKAEYLYVNLGSFNCGVACSAAAIDNVSFRANIVRAGVNYRF
jgi:outer membrane immunogenic protein